MTEIHSLVGAYVLDAVDDVERAAVDRHLTECRACRQEVTELREAAARLAEPTWSAPPPRMRAEVLARVSRTRQVSPGPAGRAPGRAGPRWRRIGTAAAAAVVLAAGAAAGAFAVQEQRVRDAQATAAAQRADADRMRAVLAAPDAVVRQGALPGGGRLTVVGSPAADAGLVVLAGAAPIAADRAYQVWLLDGGTPRPAGLLGATGAGTTAMRGLRGASAVAVTVEPAAGSAAPTTTPLVSVSLT